MYEMLLKFYHVLPAIGYTIMGLAIAALLVASYTDNLQKRALERRSIDTYTKRLTTNKVLLILFFIFSGSTLVIIGNLMHANMERQKYLQLSNNQDTAEVPKNVTFHRRELKPFKEFKGTANVAASAPQSAASAPAQAASPASAAKSLKETIQYFDDPQNHIYQD